VATWTSRSAVAWRRASAERLAAVPAWLPLAALVGVSALYLFSWASRVGTFQPDEDEYVYLARYLEVFFPESLWDFTVFSRGLQRLEVWLLAGPIALLPAPDALLVGRAVNCVAYASTAIPTYLLARGVGLPRWPALAPAAASVLVPWAVVATTVLTEPLAYPAFTWVLWASWRAVVRPSPRADALALGLVLVGGLARTSLLMLGLVPVAAALWQAARYGSWRRLPRDHPVLAAAVGAGTVALLAGAAGAGPTVRDLAGSYGTPYQVDLGRLLGRVGRSLSRVTAGTALLPMIVAAPWLARQVLRPASPERHAAATVGLLGAAIVLYQYNVAAPDERYTMYLAPVVFVAFAAALWRRDLPWWAVAIAAVLVGVLLWRQPWNGDQSGFAYFAAPAELLYGRLLLLRSDARLGGHAEALVPAAVAAAGVATGLVLARLRGPLLGHTIGLALVVLVAVQLGATQYTVSRFVNQAGDVLGPAPSERGWVDGRLFGRAEAGAFAAWGGNTVAWTPFWNEAQFWNSSIAAVVALDAPKIPVVPGDELIEVDGVAPDGRLRASRPIPSHLLIARAFRGAELVGETIPGPAYSGLDLVRLRPPARLRFQARGLEDDGLLIRGGTGAVRVFAAGVPSGTTCLRVDIGPPPGSRRAHRWTAQLGEASRRGTVRGGRFDRVVLPLAFSARRSLVARLRGLDPAALPDGRAAVLQVLAIAVERC
jgi:hypothetical protein